MTEVSLQRLCCCQALWHAGVGGALNAVTDLNNAGVVWGRLLYDNLFNIILLILLLNIIFGITIDMFAELRSSHEKNKFDKINSCTICSLPRMQFTSLDGSHGFEKHSQLDHNWCMAMQIICLVHSVLHMVGCTMCTCLHISIQNWRLNSLESSPTCKRALPLEKRRFFPLGDLY